MSSNSNLPWRIPTWFSDLSSQEQERLKIYQDLLFKFNKTINLVSQKTLLVSDAIHFADSIMASRVIAKAAPKMTHLHDFGSGNGFPGLVFGILFPEIRVSLIDTDTRKVEFLKTVIQELKLSNVETINGTLESLPEGSIQHACARGFASIAKTILMARKPVKFGGIVFHLKGEEWPNEVTEMPSQLCALWSPALVAEYRLPVGEVKFAVVKTQRI